MNKSSEDDVFPLLYPVKDNDIPEEVMNDLKEFEAISEQDHVIYNTSSHGSD